MDIIAILDLIGDNDCEMKNPTIYTQYSPSLSISDYVYRLYKYYLISDMDILKFAMDYISTYICNTNIIVNKYNIHKLTLTAVTVSHKFWNDKHFTNGIIAQIGGIDVHDLNIMEMDFLKGIKWSTYRYSTIPNLKYIMILEEVLLI